MMIQRRIEARWEGRKQEEATLRKIPLEDVPDGFLRCLLGSEDARYLKHRGVDWVEAKAAYEDAKSSGETMRGASTITMQCARSVFLWQGRSYVRKVLEIYYAFLMELMLDKAKILEWYVNYVEWGDGVYGVQTASMLYYKQGVESLNDRQWATLVAMLPNPRRWRPGASDPEFEKRITRVQTRAKNISLSNLGER